MPPFARLFAAMFILAALLAGCERNNTPDLQKAELFVFGTLVEITVSGEDASTADRAFAAINADFRRMHRDWHAWEPGPLTELNRAVARGEPAKVLPSLVPIIEQSQRLYRSSNGLFNPAIGQLLQLWGFQSNEPPNGPPPPAEEIAALVAQDPGMDDIVLENGVLVSDNTAVQMDFGAFAKGYAIDLAIARLRDMGIENAIVNAGGDLIAIGTKGGRPWRVGVRHPQGEGILAALDVNDNESVFTSGNYERFREYEGVHYTHILDPRTGYPVEGVTSVTVIAETGALADAAATALVVAGPEQWHETARRMGIRQAMLVTEEGTVHISPAMAERVHFNQPAPELRVSSPL